MKDKLRELAERWRIYGSHMTGHECAEELLSIIDAEGDGGAAGEYMFDTASKVRDYLNRALPDENKHIFGEVLAALTYAQAHPARSGVVSDENVSVVAKMIADRVGNGMREKYEETAKQIVEHFVKGERHER